MQVVISDDDVLYICNLDFEQCLCSSNARYLKISIIMSWIQLSLMPGSAPVARGPPVRRHKNIHVDMNEEREHLKSMIKEEYINEASLDDNSLLMQYFRKQDTDNNNLLDGLELLKTLAKMDCKT